MAVLTWDTTGTRDYEAGLSKGVLYFPDGGGVAWNGLTEVSSDVATDVELVWIDGIAVNQIANVGDYSGSLKAYTYPTEFTKYEGLVESEAGVFLTGQGPKPFHLSYRTSVGDDVLALDVAYKIHILWNLLAVPNEKTFQTLSLDVDPLEFEWSLTSVPEPIDLARPTSYLVIDSTKIPGGVLTNINNILYGTAGTSPNLPSLQTFMSAYAV